MQKLKLCRSVGIFMRVMCVQKAVVEMHLSEQSGCSERLMPFLNCIYVTEIQTDLNHNTGPTLFYRGGGTFCCSQPCSWEAFGSCQALEQLFGSAVVETCAGIEVTLIFLGEWSYSAAETLIHYTVMQFAKKTSGQNRVPFLLSYKIYPVLDCSSLYCCNFQESLSWPLASQISAVSKKCMQLCFCWNQFLLVLFCFIVESGLCLKQT